MKAVEVNPEAGKRRYSITHPLLLSFFSKDLYRDVARHWKGLGLLYLLSLVALCIIPGVMRVHSDFSAFASNEAPAIIRQLPDIAITKGKVSINRPEPYFIRDEKTGEPLVIIDTTGKITSLKGLTAPVLMAKDHIEFREDGTETGTFDLSGIDGAVIDRALAYRWLDTMEESFLFLFYPFALLFFFTFRLAEVFLYALLGLVMAKRMNSGLSFRSTMRLSAVAITPSLIAGSVFSLLGVTLPYWLPISVILSTTYLAFAIVSCGPRAVGAA